MVSCVHAINLASFKWRCLKTTLRLRPDLHQVSDILRFSNDAIRLTPVKHASGRQSVWFSRRRDRNEGRSYQVKNCAHLAAVTPGATGRLRRVGVTPVIGSFRGRFMAIGRSASLPPTADALSFDPCYRIHTRKIRTAARHSSRGIYSRETKQKSGDTAPPAGRSKTCATGKGAAARPAGPNDATHICQPGRRTRAERA